MAEELHLEVDAVDAGEGFSMIRASEEARGFGAPTTYTWTGFAYGPDGGYVKAEYEVSGPLYHGGGRGLEEGGQIVPGRPTNPWGEEGDVSRHVFFTTSLDTAEAYAEFAGGHVYEVEPTGNFSADRSGTDYKTQHPLCVVRKLAPNSQAEGKTRQDMVTRGVNK